MAAGGEDDERKARFPVGFQFKPEPEELVEYYLLPRLEGRPHVNIDAIIVADVYECDPEILINQRYRDRGENKWYFLSPRRRKYPGGSRPSRRTADDRGRWKPSTGKSDAEEKKSSKGKTKMEPKAQVKVSNGGVIRFFENTLAYHRGPAKDETKTMWLMHELTVPAHEIPSGNGMLLDRYVMCTIYKSPLAKYNNDDEEAETSTAREQAGPSSSQPGPAPGSVPATAAPPLSEKQAGKRPAVYQPQGPATAPKRPTLAHGPPMRGNCGGGMPAPFAVRAAGYYSIPGQPAPMPWPPVTHNGLQGPVQRTPMQYNYNNGRPVFARPYGGQAPVQGQPVLRLRPEPQQAAAAAGANSPGPTMMMRPQRFENKVTRPPYSAASQQRPPPPGPQPQLLLPKQEMDDDANSRRVLTQLIDAMRSQDAQQQRTMMSPQPCFDSYYPYKDGQQQQCGPAIPAASLPGGTAQQPSSDNAPSKSKSSGAGGANDGSGKGGDNNDGNQHSADLSEKN